MVTAMAVLGCVVSMGFLGFGLCLLTVGGGAFAGWIVSLLFDDTMREVMGQFGIHVALWKFGAFLGFVGSFFRASNISVSK